MTKEEKEALVKKHLNEAKQKYINEHKPRKHPNQVRQMVRKKFGITLGHKLKLL